MNTKLSLILVITLLLFSCKKSDQSCTDGIFDPEKEVETDCGGVCPPCDFEPTVIDNFVSTQVNDESVTFDSLSLSRTPDWILAFQNDTLSVVVNFGAGDSLGGRSIELTNSHAEMNDVTYSAFHSGTVVFTEIDHAENYLSGYFAAKFISDEDVYDTLVIKSGELLKVNW